MIPAIHANIEKSLARFMDRVKEDYKLHSVHPVLYESIREYCLRRGKRIRPLLVILSYKGYSDPAKRVSRSLYNASTCIELLHIFMLIHDDIIDRSDLRRGRPTMHRLLENIVPTKEPEKLGIDLGIIAGDIVYALAIDAFLSINEAPDRKERALKYFIQTAAFTAMGEFIDTIHGVEKIDKVTETDVYLNYTLKTARYTFVCPLVTGAILAGADEKDIRKLADLGISVGQAFQIQDDIIGIFGTEKKIGKSILSDLAESKKTLLVTHAYEHLSKTKRDQLITCFTKPRKTMKDLQTVRELFIEAGSLDYGMRSINTRVEKTLRLLDGLQMRPKYREVIKTAIFELFNQSHAIAGDFDLNARLSSLRYPDQ